jgi:hypothetical protein
LKDGSGGGGGGGGGGGAARQLAKWLAVASSVWETVLQVESSSHGGVHDTTRHEILPLHAIS